MQLRQVHADQRDDIRHMRNIGGGSSAAGVTQKIQVCDVDVTVETLVRDQEVSPPG